MLRGPNGKLQNDRGLSQPAIWRTGWTALRTLAIPAAARHHNVVSTQLNDINKHGTIAGDVYGLKAADFGALQRVYPTVWKCACGR